MACRYDYMGNRTLAAAVAAANRTKLGSHGERLSGYDAAADLTTQAAYDMVGKTSPLPTVATPPPIPAIARGRGGHDGICIQCA